MKNNFSYTPSELGGFTLHICDPEERLTVPSTYKGKPVVEIGAYGTLSNLISITIPASVQKIKSITFSDAKLLEEVIFEEGSELEVIDPSAFARCEKLEEITIPASVKNVGSNSFLECKALKRVIFEEGSILGVIESSAFKGCEALEEIELPETVRCVSDFAFSGCRSLKSISLPEPVLVLGEYVFRNCAALKKVEVHPDIEVPKIKKGAFWECFSLTEIAIPRDVEEIGWCAFRNCSALSKITFAEGSCLREVEESAFSGTAFCELDLSPCRELTRLEKYSLSTNAGSVRIIFPEGCDPYVDEMAIPWYVGEFVNKPPRCKIPTNKKKKPESKKKGCYVATCVYGSYDCPEVWTLRRYRDETLSASCLGRAFIKVYYAISPTLVKWFGNTSLFQKICRGRLDKMVASLQEKGVESTPYED